MAPFASGGLTDPWTTPLQLEPVVGAASVLGAKGAELGFEAATTAAAWALAARRVATPFKGRYPCCFRYLRPLNGAGLPAWAMGEPAASNPTTMGAASAKRTR